MFLFLIVQELHDLDSGERGVIGLFDQFIAAFAPHCRVGSLLDEGWAGTFRHMGATGASWATVELLP